MGLGLGTQPDAGEHDERAMLDRLILEETGQLDAEQGIGRLSRSSFHASVAASTMTGTSPNNTSRVTHPASTDAVSVHATSYWPSSGKRTVTLVWLSMSSGVGVVQ